ncbi:MAG: hypothetical protein NC339_01595 [Muribaculaceae bacterium]|nr:hypothetical protein [Muribaculaceae bacterium]
MTLKHLPAYLLALSLTACSTDGESDIPGVGSLSITLEMQTAMLTPDGKPSGVEIPYQPSSDQISLTLTALQGQYSHTWDDFSKFPQADDYFAGSYEVSVATSDYVVEGYDRPVFAGTDRVEVIEGRRTDAKVKLLPVVAFFQGETLSSQSSTLHIDEIDLHTPGGVYHTLNTDAAPDSYLCMQPGATTLYVTLARADESVIRLQALELSTMAGALYIATATLTDNTLTVSCSGRQAKLTVSEQMFDAIAPEIETSWPDGSMILPEGDNSDKPLVATVESGSSPLSHLYLSMASASLKSLPGFTPQIDLLNLSEGERLFLEAHGLDVKVTAEGGTVDFTDFVGSLTYLTPATDTSVFTLEAVDALGISATPTSLTVVTTPVNIEVTGAEKALIGIDKAVIHVACNSPGFATHVDVETLNHATGLFELVPVTVTRVDEGNYDVAFTVPAGSTPVEARVLYCGEERATVMIERAQPEFEIEVDAFASTAGVKINPSDPALTAVITSGVNIYINGKEAPLYQRIPDEGIVAIIGLSPSTTYTFTATMMNGVPQPEFTAPVTIRTEGTRQLPNADFEQRTNGIIYPDLPSGGRYSQTTVEIFNWQHHTTFQTESPEGWATTNDKTFCRKSSNHNTWYMQPSMILTREVAASLSYSAKLTTVAFDPQGEEIPDYVQTGQPYLTYSPVIPNIKYRAAGKLFLGSYRFNAATMEETYNQGIAWTTRPRSLNGFYRFLPPVSHRSASALVMVELTGMKDGEETVIAHSEVKLPLASDFTAFNVPLTYKYFGVKATGIKVMFASSSDCGTIQEETSRLITDPDPLTATSKGGTLWIDNITLAY